MTGQTDNGFLVYIGTYTRGESEGIYVYRLDASSGALEPAGTPAQSDNPSFLAIHPGKGYLYAVNEVGEFGGKSSGAVSAFGIDAETGALRFLNQQPTLGPGPCHVSVDPTGKWVLVANYSGGSVAVFPAGGDGALGEATDFIQHEGSSVNPRRQQGPHAHSITLDPTGRFAYAADLGLDKVMIYELDAGKLRPADPPWAQVHAGAGPRHFVFHPDGRRAYLINELDSTVTVFEYDSSRGALSEVQRVSTLPEGFSGTTHTADIHVSPDGKFVYGSNRGHDSLAIFAVDGVSGKLESRGHTSTQGKTPRNLAVDPSGQFVMAANQATDTVVVFRRDGQTGALTPTGHVARVPSPVCLKALV